MWGIMGNIESLGDYGKYRESCVDYGKWRGHAGNEK